jgi:serine phosphatase RsbU (regulator of sigma subunit)
LAPFLVRSCLDVDLEPLRRAADLATDGHFATVLVGVGDIDTRSVVLANAGHFPPLILSAAGAEFAEVAVGLTLGVEPGTYEATTISMAEGSTLIAFTDGLVERRGETWKWASTGCQRWPLHPSRTSTCC